jgi:chorismate synthase
MNTFGRIFNITIFGESHGQAVGVNIDGCPAGIHLTEDDLLKDISRRKSGAKGTTPRTEKDQPHILSGVFNGYTTGAPVTIIFHNTNTRSGDYSELKYIPRPGHADFTALKKFGSYSDYRGGGHFSGRLTVGIVAAGVIAKKMIQPALVNSQILEVGGDTNIEHAVNNVIKEYDSVGGLIECKVTGLPTGLGEPFFDSMESRLAHAIFSVPAIKGLEFGSGFKVASMKGSEHNDSFVSTDGKTRTNNAAGINGGITNGNDIIFRVAVKPTSSIGKEQHTINLKTGEMTDLKIEGRHDSCIALRIPPVIEAMAAIVLADFYLLEQKISRVWNPKEIYD